jgi:hypothetical protein
VLVSIPFGFPTGRDVITAGCCCSCSPRAAASGGSGRRSVVRDWLPLIAVLFLYDFLRGAADEVAVRFVDLQALDTQRGFGRADRLRPTCCPSCGPTSGCSAG